MISKTFKILGVLLLAVLLQSTPGCTARSLTITTNPPGAEVSVNYRVIGTSPCRVGFTHYGVYRIEIRKEKFETMVREECINPPIYGYDPLTVVADNAIPARLNDDVYLHFVLKAAGDVSERSALLQRAAAAASGMGTNTKNETVQLAYTRPPKTPEQLAKQAEKDAQKPAQPSATAPGTGTGTGTGIKKPDEFTVKPLEEKEPEGPKISKELGIKPSLPDKKPDAPKVPQAPTDPKKDLTPPRTPKPEELIFDKPDAPKK